MEPLDIAHLLGRIEQKLDDQTGELTDFKVEQAAANSRLEAKQDYTNGKVRGLELFKARCMGVIAVAVFASPFVLPALLHVGS